jgi:TPR repeat protein
MPASLILVLFLSLSWHSVVFSQEAPQGGVACSANDKPACHHQAFQAAQNKDFARAKSLYETNCKNGYPESCYNRGFLAREENNIEEERTWFAAGCKLNDGNSCNTLGFVEEGSNHFSEARALYGEACVKGEKLGCDNLINLHYVWYYLGDKALAHWNAIKDAKDKIAALTTACTAGDLEACQLEGWSVVQSSPLAAQIILEKACRAGYAPSCLTVIATGKYSFHEQIPFVELACKGNLIAGCVAASDMHFNENDLEKVKLFDEAACKLGRDVNCAKLDLRAKKPGAMERIRLAYQKECESGDPGGCGWLSFVEEKNGNAVAAAAAHKKACQFGDSFSCPKGLNAAGEPVPSLRERVPAADRYRRVLPPLILGFGAVAGLLTAFVVGIRRRLRSQVPKDQETKKRA